MAKTSLKDMTRQLRSVLAAVGRYRVLLFVILVAAVYAFVFWRVQTLESQQPTDLQVSEQNDPIRTAHVNKSVVEQLNSLQDNSVNVHALFDQARNNPFQD